MPIKGLNAMLDAARRLMTPSARSDVPPFMVMDVMAAAARIEAAGGRVIHMEVGQPAAPAPATAIAAARAALDVRPARLYRDARHPDRCARASRGTTARPTASIVDPGAHRRHHRLVGGLHPGVPRAVRAGRPRGDRAARLSALSPHPHGARLRAGADRDRRRRRAGRSRPRCCSRRIARRRSRAC